MIEFVKQRIWHQWLIYRLRNKYNKYLRGDQGSIIDQIKWFFKSQNYFSVKVDGVIVGSIGFTNILGGRVEFSCITIDYLIVGDLILEKYELLAKEKGLNIIMAEIYRNDFKKIKLFRSKGYLVLNETDKSIFYEKKLTTDELIEII